MYSKVPGIAGRPRAYIEIRYIPPSSSTRKALKAAFAVKPLKENMEKNFTILIADRNRHVREFLKREMTAAGYEVCLAKSGREVLKWIYADQFLDLIILDLDLPDTSGKAILEKLENRIPALPVVVHAFLSDYSNHRAVLGSTVFVEKMGNSIEKLKKVVADILKNVQRRKTVSRKDASSPLLEKSQKPYGFHHVKKPNDQSSDV